jgi:23S rRNA (uracil1939-C5)-methyltransferase
VGRLEDGRTVFVPRTAAGDLVELTQVRLHRRFARARTHRLLERSPDRIEPSCPHYVGDDCGGCQLQHLNTAAQRSARRGFVGDALRRIAGLDVSDPEIVPAAQEFGYRTKITLAVGEGGRRIGLHPLDAPARVFELERCHITRDELMVLWTELRGFRSLLPPALRQLVLRLDRDGGRHVLLVVDAGADQWRGGETLAAALAARGLPARLWIRAEESEPRPLAVRPGEPEPYPATVFEQVHPAMGDRVRAFAIGELGRVAGRQVWDLYAGIGETTALLLSAGAQVQSVESDRRAVAEAEARGPAATRLAGRVERLLGRLRRPDLVITNPPRTGMDERVTAELARLGPERIVYISCDPATLARDLSRLPGFRVIGAVAFDLFPQTAHVETVVTLERA